MPLSLADVLSAQAGGGPVYEGGPDANVTPGGVLTALGLGGPSWLDAAGKQTGADIAAYQRGGVPELMADTGPTQELAGGFGGTTTPAKGIRAYHGSPYDFEKFDISKIGTGEGAQSYGHGLYFAENPATAKNYRESLAGNIGNRQDPYGAADRNFGSGPDEAIANLQSQLKSTLQMQERMREVGRPTEHIDQMAQMYRDAMDVVKGGYKPGGKMYEVNINAEPQQFLQWNKPLADQPEQVRKFFESYKGAGPVYPDTPGQNLPGFLTKQLSSGNSYLPSGAERSQIMSEAGIPGIRYLDQGSLGMLKFGPDAAGNWDFAHTAPSQQTHNYVVFNPEIVDILKKYGLAGLTMGGVLSAAGQEPAPSQ